MSAVGSTYNVSQCITSRQVNFITTSILLQNEEELTEVWSHVSEIEAEFEDRESCVVNQQIPVRFYIMILYNVSLDLAIAIQSVRFRNECFVFVLGDVPLLGHISYT